MNILYLTNHLNIGGISSYVLTLAKGLKAKGHNIYIASGPGELIEQFKREGINYIPIPIKTKAEIGPKVLISLMMLENFMKEKKIDIIHANTRVTQVLACLFQKRTKRPFISTCHGFFKKRLLRRIFPCWGLRVIAISEQVKEHLIKDFKVDEKNITVIHNGVDVEKFGRRKKEEGRRKKEELGLGSGPVVGIIARLSDVKGHVYLIEAMKSVLQDVPNAQLLIVGEGKMKNKLARLIAKLAIDRNVVFLPSVRDTASVLSIMDIFVMPSIEEGLGLSLMEAMAAGVAVIGSDVGGIKSLIMDGENGLLVKPKDALGIQEAILGLLKDEQKREFLGKNARIFIAQNFSQEKMLLQTEGVYSECLKERY